MSGITFIAFVVGVTLASMIVGALLGLLFGFLIALGWDDWLPFPLDRWPNARGYFMLAAVAIGALTGLVGGIWMVIAFIMGD